MGFGRLERTTGPQPMSEINVTPLVDVMLVLVVIFILTSAALLASSIQLELPRPERVPGARRCTPHVGGRSHGPGVHRRPAPHARALAARLAEAPTHARDTEIQLRADAAACPTAAWFEIMGAAHAAGLARIGFVSGAPEITPPGAAPSRAALTLYKM